MSVLNGFFILFGIIICFTTLIIMLHFNKNKIKSTRVVEVERWDGDIRYEAQTRRFWFFWILNNQGSFIYTRNNHKIIRVMK